MRSQSATAASSDTCCRCYYARKIQQLGTTRFCLRSLWEERLSGFLVAAPAVRNVWRKRRVILIWLFSFKMLQIDSAVKSSFVSAFYEWEKTTLIRLSDGYRIGVWDIRLWCGSGFRWFANIFFLIQFSSLVQKRYSAA